ncbi:MAG: hypothetical protein ABL918_10290 [Chakrabartia sp.]
MKPTQKNYGATHKNVALHPALKHSNLMQDNKLLFEAIALKKCITATYNSLAVKLAPHILYTRHDELYLDAVTVERQGMKPRDIKVGAFKITGLKDVALTDQHFESNAVFDPSAEKYADVTVFMIEK